MATDTIQQTLPPASISTASDGGLGYHDLFDRNACTYVEVGPLIRTDLTTRSLLSRPRRHSRRRQHHADLRLIIHPEKDLP